jgi:hypothetical protein
MVTQEYLLALGENRWAFAIADYEMASFLMAIDPGYQALIDTPVDFNSIKTSKKMARDLVTRIDGTYAPSHFKMAISTLADDWTALALQRNNLVHAWGFQDRSGASLLGGLSHDFPKGRPPVREMTHWTADEVRRMTAACSALCVRIGKLREKYEELNLPRYSSKP